jgi:REP element-mobilizing transposase RayT
MARALRIEAVGCWYHITARGNNRQPIFRQVQDRRRFLELLGDMVERYRFVVHAFVLMDNHYHLLVQTQEANLSRAMQWLGVSYTVWFNRRYHRVGHLFQGRFHAVALEEAVAAEVSRYVHLNPVRLRALGLDKAAQQRASAGLTAVPAAKLVRERLQRLRQWRWSSYRAYVGWERPAGWLTRAPILAMIGGPKQERGQWGRHYREYVEQAVRDGLPESPWQRLEAQVLLGSAEFVARMRSLARGDEKEQPSLRRLRVRPGFDQVVAAVEARRGERWEQWRDRYGDWGRDAVLHLGRKHCGLTLRELGAAAGGLDYRSVGTAMKNFKKRLVRDKTLVQTVAEIEAELKKKEM